MSEKMLLIASCPKGLEQLLAAEVSALGGEPIAETVGSIRLYADLATAYRLCLWSRIANRVLLVLAEFSGNDADELYAGVHEVDWSQHLARNGTFAVDFIGKSREIRNTHFAALKCKDAVVDSFLSSGEERPSIDTSHPDLRIHVRLRKGEFFVALDLSGESLHRRGYRSSGGLAPLKENLAAALLVRANWAGLASRGAALIDPMCGSGTILIEAAQMAMGIAPGLQRRYWGFSGWLGHQPDLWNGILQEADQQAEQAAQRRWPEIRGYDASGKIIAEAEDNIERAGLTGHIRVQRRELSELSKPSHTPMPLGLLITNPPYGERLGAEAELVHLYRHLGESLKAHFTGWQAAIFTGNPELGKRMGIRSNKKYALYNGTIPAQLLLFDVQPEYEVKQRSDGETNANGENLPPLSPGGQMFANRLQKNIKRLSKWRRKNDIDCYRVYDADMPEYSVAIDVYNHAIHIAEYVAPATIEEKDALRRLRDVVEACGQVFEVPSSSIAIKERRRQRGRDQYQKGKEHSKQLEVREGQAKLLVNLHDYLDTGLFLDHRPVRLDISARAKGARFLNLFCYTGTATVHAGLGGARHTTSVDMSRTYLQWARQNLSLNGLSESRHRTEQADCRRWLKDCEEKFDLILLDPPTFSNSKRMDDVLDIQEDHAELIDDAMKCLATGGLLIFSNNKRDFKMDAALSERYQLEDKCQWSLDEDYKRRSKPIHHCWYISAVEGS